MELQFSQELSTGNIESTNPRKKFNIYLLICLIVVLVITIPVIIVLAVKLSKKSDEYDEKEKEFKSLHENYIKLDNDKAYLDKEFKTLKQNHEELENKYSNLNDDYNSLQEENEELKINNSNLSREFNSLKEENVELKNNNTDLNKRLNLSEEENEELKNNNTDLNERLNLLEEENEELKTNNTGLNNRLNLLEEENEELKKYIDIDLIEQLNLLEEEKEELKNNNTDLGNKLNNLKEEHEQLENQYSNQNDTLHYIFKDVYQNLILTSNISHSNVDKIYYISIIPILQIAHEYPVGIYELTPLNKVNYNKGYQVGFETNSRNWMHYNFDQYDEYDDIIYKLSSLLGVNANLEVFSNYYARISFHIEDLFTSLSIAAFFNQKSIWDWANNCEILNTFHQPKYY